ncbi:hypothetical protein L7F22_022061 [Adiantum nelumboides]|nr:hypothetical protein [Adiantum nelumboides]
MTMLVLMAMVLCSSVVAAPELLPPPYPGTVHTVKEFPTHMPEALKVDESTSLEIQSWNRDDSCPHGTIPILRKNSTTKVKPWKHRPQRVVRENKESIGTIEVHHNINESTDNYALYAPGAHPETHEHVIAQYSKAPIYGGYGVLNVWNPSLQLLNEMTLSQMWLLSGKFDGHDLNSIEVGWQVNPLSFGGDSSTRLFIYWTSDSYTNTGCYNLDCPGFVQVSSSILLGAPIKPASTYAGSQFDLNPVYVYKDVNTGSWWLYLAGTFVGYWPSSLFTHLANHAELLQWGGEIVNLRANGQHTTTQMGSGHFASEGFQKSCFSRSLKAVDSTFKAKDIPVDDLDVSSSNPSCYDAQKLQIKNWGTTIFFGGPGRNPNCL